MVARSRLALNLGAVALAVLALFAIGIHNYQRPAPLELLNVSYDPTRELYGQINTAFADLWQKKWDSRIHVTQSHGGSSRQAARVASGELKADVVTLGLPSDIDGLQERGLLAEGWQERLPNRSRPYYSTIVFVVRKGNPQQVHDWPDLVRDGVEIIVPDPRSSGNGKLAALAAWGSVVRRGGSDRDAQEYLKRLYRHTPFLLPAARAAGLAFTQEKIGDVHLAWENEALREVEETHGSVEIVYPPISIRAEPAVAWLDANVHGQRQEALARAYLEYLFTDEAQEIIARNGYRPFNAEILARHASALRPIDLFEIGAIAKDWRDAQARFFSDGGIIDLVYTPKPR